MRGARSLLGGAPGRRAALIACLAVFVALTLTGTAGAAATIGSPLARPPVKASCGTGTFFNSVVASPAIVKAPYSGVIVSWRLDLQEPGGAFEYRLRVVTPPKALGGKYKFIASGPPQVAPSAGVNVLTLPHPIPIEAGQIVAFDCEEEAPSPLAYVLTPDGTTFGYFGSIPADGETAAATGEVTNDETLVNADIVGLPSLTAVAPSVVGARGGSTVTLAGEHLGDLTAATVGGATTSVTPISETEARLTVPAHPAGGADVTVTNPAGTSNALSAAYVGPPTISSFTQKRKKWKRKKGTAFSFTLNEAASAKLTVTHGRRGAGKCRRTRPHCGLTIDGSLSIAAKAGANRVVFKGKLHGRALKPRHYKVTLSVNNAFGETATAKPLSFEILG